MTKKLMVGSVPVGGGTPVTIQSMCNTKTDQVDATVAQIHGRDRVEGVTLTKVDDNGKPIPGSEWEVPCDTLLLSCGLIPENELTRGLGADMDGKTGGPIVGENLECSIPGVFACGNVLHVHELVDHVSAEAEKAGNYAVEYIRQKRG